MLFTAHRLVYHSTLGWSVIKKKQKDMKARGVFLPPSGDTTPCKVISGDTTPLQDDRSDFTWGTTPCKMTGVTLHGVVTGVTLDGVDPQTPRLEAGRSL